MWLLSPTVKKNQTRYNLINGKRKICEIYTHFRDLRKKTEVSVVSVTSTGQKVFQKVQKMIKFCSQHMFCETYLRQLLHKLGNVHGITLKRCFVRHQCLGSLTPTWQSPFIYARFWTSSVKQKSPHMQDSFRMNYVQTEKNLLRCLSWEVCKQKKDCIIVTSQVMQNNTVWKISCKLHHILLQLQKYL